MAAPYAIITEKNPDDVLNYCTKYLSRGMKFFKDSPSANPTNLVTVSEDWRFPIVLPSLDGDGLAGTVNEVTFVYLAKADERIGMLEIVGNFAPLYKTFKMSPVLYEGNNIGYYSISMSLPTGKGYHYRFIKDGQDVLDGINPQIKTFKNGKQWSFFFTDYYNYSLEFEEWELRVLGRLVSQIIPFRSEDAQNFINRFYLSLARPDKLAMPIYQLDDSVGELNFITNILARQERHHLADYKICISLIDQLLRKRNPYVESWKVSEELIIDLYNEMSNGQIAGWDYTKYSNPTYFFSLIRRHTIMGAFCHPKYGGNIGGAGWNYLQEKYSIKNDLAQTVGSDFMWQLAIEKPLGTNADYKG